MGHRLTVQLEYFDHSVLGQCTIAHLKSIEPLAFSYHLYKIQILFFSDHSLMWHQYSMKNATQVVQQEPCPVYAYNSIYTNKPCQCYCLVNSYIACIYTLTFLLLQVIFAITQNQLIVPEMYALVHASILIKPGHIWISGSSRSVMLTRFQP